VLDTWDEAVITSSELLMAKRRRFLGMLSDAIDPLLNGDRSVHSLFSNVGSGAWGEISDTGLRILRNADFGLDGILSLEAAPVRQLSTRDLARTQLVSGDIVLEKSGGGPDQPVGRVSRFLGPQGYGYSNFLLRLTPKRENNAQFCYFVLERMYQRRDPLYFQQQTTGIRNLEWRDYLDLPITVPSFAEQSRISATLSAAELSVQQESKILALLRAQKIGLIQKLLSGQLRVPASIEVLLPDHVQETA
jgi:type I restriction enzyme S subunit